MKMSSKFPYLVALLTMKGRPYANNTEVVARYLIERVHEKCPPADELKTVLKSIGWVSHA